MENEEMEKSNPNMYDFIETMAEQILQRLDDIERVLQGIVPKSTIKVEYLNGEMLFEPTRRYMEENLMPTYRGKIKILPSGLQDKNIAILGAAALGMQKVPFIYTFYLLHPQK